MREDERANAIPLPTLLLLAGGWTREMGNGRSGRWATLWSFGSVRERVVPAVRDQPENRVHVAGPCARREDIFRTLCHDLFGDRHGMIVLRRFPFALPPVADLYAVIGNVQGVMSGLALHIRLPTAGRS